MLVTNVALPEHEYGSKLLSVSISHAKNYSILVCKTKWVREGTGNAIRTFLHDSDGSSFGKPLLKRVPLALSNTWRQLTSTNNQEA